MACRRLTEMPKKTFRYLYLQPSLSAAISSQLTARQTVQLGWTLCRCASGGAVTPMPAIPELKDNIYRRFRRKIGWPDYTSAFYRAMGVFIYERIDGVPMSEFFKEFQLEDSFYSWYLVMELHLWMILSRATQHKKEGRIVKEYIGKVMWEDVRRRMKLIASDMPASDTSKTLDNLNSELEFAVVLYDEAVCSDDKRLAEALWIRLYRGKEVDPVVLEKLVCYVRKQVRHLDLIPREKFLLKAQFSWLPLKECRI